MDKIPLSILGLYRAEFEKAKTTEQLTSLCQAAIALSAVVSVFAVDESVIYASAIFALIVTIAERLLSYKTNQQQHAAERGRRAVLLMDGLGYKLSTSEISDIADCFSVSEQEGKKWEDRNYFRTTLPTGPARLAEILQESAFFSYHLYRWAANFCWVIFSAILILSVIILLVAPVSLPDQWPVTIAKIMCVVFMFIITIDLFRRAFEYREAADVAHQIDTRLEDLKKVKVREHDLIIVLSDYDASVQNTPLIPTFAYQRNVKQINRLWQNRIEVQEHLQSRD